MARVDLLCIDPEIISKARLTRQRTTASNNTALKFVKLGINRKADISTPATDPTVLIKYKRPRTGIAFRLRLTTSLSNNCQGIGTEETLKRFGEQTVWQNVKPDAV